MTVSGWRCSFAGPGCPVISRRVLVMKWITWLLALVLVAASCRAGDSDPATTTTGGAVGTTTVVAPTTTSPIGETTTTMDDTTTTSPTAEETTTTAPRGAGPGDEAVFTISRVVFGDEGYVSIKNVGGVAGNLEGWQLCQRPAYYRIGSVEVAAGETVHFATGSAPDLAGQVIESNGRFGPLGAGGGEIGLYVDNSFSSASSIRSYVEWGSSDHGRSSVAVAAGIWTAGGFVPSEGVPGLAATVDVPTGPSDWATS